MDFSDPFPPYRLFWCELNDLTNGEVWSARNIWRRATRSSPCGDEIPSLLRWWYPWHCLGKFGVHYYTQEQLVLFRQYYEKKISTRCCFWRYEDTGPKTHSPSFWPIRKYFLSYTKASSIQNVFRFQLSKCYPKSMMPTPYFTGWMRGKGLWKGLPLK